MNLTSELRAIVARAKSIEAIVADTKPVTHQNLIDRVDLLAEARDIVEIALEVIEEYEFVSAPCESPTCNPITRQIIRCEREVFHGGAHGNLTEPLTWK